MDSNISPGRSKARRTDDGSRKLTTYGDNDETPRAPQTSVHPLSVMSVLPSTLTNEWDNSFRPRRSQNALSQSSESDYSSASSTGSKRQRTGNVTGKLDDGQYAKYPIMSRTITRMSEIPDSMRELVTIIRGFSNGWGVLTERHATWKECVGSGIAREDEGMFAYDVEGKKRDALGQIPQLKWAERLVERAIRNDIAHCSEAAWGSGVYDFILDKALRKTPYSAQIRWENITTARIFPTTLIPEVSKQDRADSKRVDFCIALELDKGIGNRLFQAGITSLNHTDCTGIRWNPIAISIETKAAMAGSAEGTLQLSTWSTSHITFLRQLLSKTGNSHVPTPPLPLIMIVGHQWYFYCMEDRKTSGRLWRGDPIGKTDSLLGTYQIIAGLQYLVQWAQNTYRPWFEEFILEPLLITAQTEP